MQKEYGIRQSHEVTAKLCIAACHTEPRAAFLDTVCSRADVVAPEVERT